MEKATYRQLQNFNNEVDEDKEFDIILSLMRPEDYGILKMHPGLSPALLIDSEHVLAYRKLLEEGEEVTPESFKASLDAIYTYNVFHYYTDDLEELKRYPIGYLSDNFTDMYDNEGYELDFNDTFGIAHRTKDTKLTVDLNHCYVINKWTYEIRS